MASEVEIAKLVVRLFGDGSDFQNMLKAADESLKTTSTVTQDVGKKFETLQTQVNNAAKSIKEGLAAAGIASSLKGMLDSYSGAEERTIGLTAAMEVHGRAVESTMADYKQFAQTMAGSTTMSRGSIMELVKLAEAHGLTGEAAKKAATQAIQLSYATGSSAEVLMHSTIAAAEGHTQALRRALGPAARGIKDQSELINKANELMRTGAVAMGRIAESSTGQLAALNNSIKSISYELGGIVSSIINPFIKTIQGLVEAFKALPEPVKQVVVALVMASTAMAAWATVSGVVGPIATNFWFLTKAIWAAGAALVYYTKLTTIWIGLKWIATQVSIAWAAISFTGIWAGVSGIYAYISGLTLLSAWTMLVAAKTAIWAAIVTVATGGINLIIPLVITTLGVLEYFFGWFGKLFGFISSKIKDWLGLTKTEAAAGGAGIGAALTQGMAKETHKLDSVLYGTAESMRKIYDYRNLLNTISPTMRLTPAYGGGATQQGGMTSTTTSTSMQPVGGGVSSGQTVKVEMMGDVIKLLTDISNGISRMRGRATSTAPAGINS